MDHASSGILEHLTIDDVRALQPNTAVLPIGSTEPHGPALPYGTDRFTAEALAYGAVPLANARGGRAVALPAQPISLNNNFRQFPLACRMSVPTFIALLDDLVSFLHADGIERIVVLNGHGGNPEAIRAALRHIARQDGPFVCHVDTMSCPDAAAWQLIEHSSDHAGESESSVMLHLRPDLVHAERLADQPTHQPAIPELGTVGAWFARPWHAYMPASCGGDARTASAAKGRALIEAGVARLAELVLALSTAPTTVDFPYGP